MRTSSIVVVLLAVGASLASPGDSSAQKTKNLPPPPPQIIFSDPAKPHLLEDRLDYSFCQYPQTARRAGLEGCCRMKVEVARDGAARVLGGQCSDDVFLPVSRSCLAPQSYRPAIQRGKAVKATGDVVVYYELTKPPPQQLSLIDKVLGALFAGPAKAPPAKKPEPDFCEKRPDDMISWLPTGPG